MTDTRVEFDTQDKVTMKLKLGRYLRDWTIYLPIALSVIAIVLYIVTLAALLVYINDLKQQVNTLRYTSTEAPLQSISSSSPGAAYIRWGKSGCPDDNMLIYAGFAAGSSSSSPQLPGGGANHLCMHPQAEWNKFDTSNDSHAYSWLYGVEYLSFNDGIFADEVHGHNVPCSACLSPRTSQIMIPGRRTCPLTWTKEYDGYVMSSHSTSTKTTYQCVDASPDIIEGSRNVTGGSLLFFTVASCGPDGGSLARCPPYVDAREVTCVVCTK